MKQRVQRMYSGLVKGLLYLLLSLTVFGVIRAPQLDIERLTRHGFFVLVLVIVASMVLWLNRVNVRQWLRRSREIGAKHLWVIVLGLTVVGLMIQIGILLCTRTPIGWDVGSIVGTAIDPTKNVTYFSVYPNNLSLTTLYRALYLWLVPATTAVKDAWLFFQVINTLMLDGSVVILTYAMSKFFNHQIALDNFLLFFLLLFFTPFIQTPYSDITVLLPVSLAILSYYYLGRASHAFGRITLSIACGFLFGITYVLKPSAVILLIAWLIETLLGQWLSVENKAKWQRVLTVGLVVVSFVGSTYAVNHAVWQYTAVPVQKGRAMPWQHYVLMGMIGTGGFDQQLTIDTAKLIDPDAMKAYSVQQIPPRLKALGVLGYGRFLAVKQIRNTAGGDFAWGYDGLPQVPFTRAKNSTEVYVRSLYIQGRSRQGDLGFYFQVVWLVLVVGLGIALLAYRPIQDGWISVLMLTMLGAFLYLLLFEGGRSRYLIQYLPALVPLAAWGWNTGRQRLSERIRNKRLSR